MKASLSGRKLIVPLSYGGSNESCKRIIEEGEKLIGKNNFIPLLDFLSLEEYNKIILQAEYAIYGNWRQEAVGNVLVALYLGMKVFLSKRNPLVKIFEDMGLLQ